MTEVERIPEEWRQFVVPMADVHLFPGNAKLHDLPTIKRSLRKRGQYRMAVVQRSTGFVCVGNGMVEAMREEGWTELAVHYRDLTDHAARELVLLDNKSGEMAGYDPTALVSLLESLPGLDDTGWTSEELADLVAATAPPDLDELHDRFGDPQDDDTHVRITLRVPRDVADLWSAAQKATGVTDPEELDVAMVRAAHTALVTS